MNPLQIANDNNTELSESYGVTIGNQEIGDGGNCGEERTPTAATDQHTVVGVDGFFSLGMLTYLYEGKTATQFFRLKEPDPASGEAGYIEKTYSYTTNAAQANYYGSAVERKNYHLEQEDPNLTAENVQNGYVQTLLKTYGGSSERIKKYFGYIVKSTEYPYIYVEAVPVHRVLETDSSKLSTIGYYVVNQFENVAPGYEQDTWELSDWYIDTYYCDNGTPAVSNTKCRTGYNDCTKPVISGGQTSCGDGYTYTLVSYKYINGRRTPLYNCTPIPCSDPVYSSETPKPYWSLPAQKPGKRVHHIMYGRIKTGPSYLKTSIETGKYLTRAVDYCSTNFHDKEVDKVYNESGNYIGPNKQNALVGVSGTPYILHGSCTSLDATLGRQHIWLEGVEPDIIGECEGNSCPPEDKVCQVACHDVIGKGKDSDEYLQCAENYCEALVNVDLDRDNARKKKRDCMLTNCEYVYGKSPTGDATGKDRQSVDSCANSTSPYKDVTQKLTSTCNKDNSSNSDINKLKGVTVEKCFGNTITDFDRDETGVLNESNDEPFDQRTYINKICKEEVSFSFTDLKEQDLPTAGTGFTYPITETGNRQCTYFFDLEQWKFDYASIPGREKEQRQRLRYILEQFNQANKENKTKNEYNPIFDTPEYGGDSANFGKVDYKSEVFDFRNSTVEVEIKEMLVNGKLVSPTTQVVELETGDSVVTSPSLSTIAITDGTKKHVTVVENNSRDYSREVKKFESTARGSVTYGLQKVCVSNDGNATVSAAPGNGICDTNENGNVYAERKHYTDFKIKLDNENPVITKVSVLSSDGKKEYYTDEEQCTYSVSSNKKCKLIMKVTEGKQLSKTEAIADKVTIDLKYDVPTSPISKSITDIIKNNVNNELSTKHDGETATIFRTNGRSDEVHELVGEVTYKNFDGATETVTCDLEVSLKYIGGSCGLSCDIEKVTDKNYSINSTGNSPTFWSYYISRKEDQVNYSLDYDFFTEITPSETNKSYINLASTLQKGDVLYGYIRTNNENCTALCPYPDGGTFEDRPNCLTEFEPTQRKDIYKYCTDEENLKKDVNDFIDSDDCMETCSTYQMCQNDKCDKDAATTFCDKWRDLGYPSEISCMHECYRDCSTGTGSSYLFRTVDVTNPFPESQESEYPYVKGKRIVGANWNQLSSYITNDSSDETTITGDNVSKNMVEYIIDLTAEDIRNIRKDTTSSGLNDLKRTRAVYAKLDRVKTGSKLITAYKSNFLHESQFTILFQPKHGKTISTFKP